MKIWLDDIRDPPEGWRWCKTIEEVIGCLMTANVEEMSLDHDLGHDMLTGYGLVRWMETNAVWPCKPQVHSMNPVGAANMRAVIDKRFPDRVDEGKCPTCYGTGVVDRFLCDDCCSMCTDCLGLGYER